MVAATRLYSPTQSVVVFKTIRRSAVSGDLPVSERYRGALEDGIIDLTPFLGEQGGVRTNKSVTDPAGGFTVTLNDQEYGPTLDSIYAALEPMDLVEIRMSREPLMGARAPVVMRGFISEVARDENMGDDGRPGRTVIISGQDFGKLWQISQVLPLAERILKTGAQLYQQRVLERFGMGMVSTLGVAEFVREITARALTPVLQRVVPEQLGSRVPRSFGVNVLVPPARVSIPGLTNVNSGNVYELLKNFTDVGVWNELFIEDREEAVVVVLRPFPAVELGSGEFIQPVPGFASRMPSQAVAGPAQGGGGEAEDGALPAGFVEVAAEDVKALRTSRSDAKVANFFYAESSRFDLARTAALKTFQIEDEAGSVDMRAYPNASAALYGDREMRADVATWPDEIPAAGTGQTKEQIDKDVGEYRDFLRERRAVLSRQNRDNIVLESGSMRLVGRPDIRAGMYLRFTRGGLTWVVYAERVEHEFVAFTSFFTTVTFSRGTAFAERIRAARNTYQLERT